jgi:hypothetical protein
MNTRRWRGFSLHLVLVLLLIPLHACTSDEDPPVSQAQAYFFTESLKQIEAGGRQLQAPDLDEPGLEAALAMLDQGLRLAFQVEREGLDRLDLRLGKNYQRYFIEGVENYRLGIEAGDETQQQEGLRLLARWADFWGREGAAITARLEPS